MGLNFRRSRFIWLLALAAPGIGLVVLHTATGFGLRDVRALGRYLSHRRAADAVAWRSHENQAEVVDFAPLPKGALLVLQGGRLARLEGDAFRDLGSAQGTLRFFPLGRGEELWAGGTYHRLLGWSSARGVQHQMTLEGALREVQGDSAHPVVGFEGEALDRGWVQGFRTGEDGVPRPEGASIQVGMDRWSTFSLSPDGHRVLANLPGGKGIAVWSLEDGRQLASWPAERLSRILCFLDNERVLFERGPARKGLAVAYADPENRLSVARVGNQDGVTVTENFASVLSVVCWPDHSRLAFSDMEGLVRVVNLTPEPRLSCTFAPRGRGIPWRLRADENRLWILFKGEKARIEGFEVK